MNVNWAVNFEFQKLHQLRKCKYEKKTVVEDPSTIMSLLNSQVTDIRANARLATYMTADGNIFIMGRDYRAKAQLADQDADFVYGIPK